MNGREIGAAVPVQCLLLIINPTSCNDMNSVLLRGTDQD